MNSTTSKYKTESEIEFERAYPNRKGEYHTNVWINDVEYDAVIVYRDEGHYTTVPYPEVTLESIVICPCNGLVIDLYADGYDWLVNGQLEDSLICEIEGDLIQKHHQSRQEAETA